MNENQTTASDLDAALEAAEPKAAPAPAAKKTVAKKTVAKKAVAKPAATKAPAKSAVKKDAANPAATKSPVKTVAKKTSAKPAAVKATDTPSAAKTPVAKKSAAKPAAQAKPVAKKAAAKLAAPSVAPAAPAQRTGRQHSPLTVSILALEVGESYVVLAELTQLNKVQANVRTVIMRTIAKTKPSAKFEVNRATVVAPVTGAKVRYAILIERVK